MGFNQEKWDDLLRYMNEGAIKPEHSRQLERIVATTPSEFNLDDPEDHTFTEETKEFLDRMYRYYSIST
jgi:hypothetical protein